MSLDVSLIMKGSERPVVTKIFIREDGQNKELTPEEWNDRFPGREPYTVNSGGDECVFDYNITHNLNRMAKEVGLYLPLWQPENVPINRAGELIPILEEGLLKLELTPRKWKLYNPPNGWGDYEGLVKFVRCYLEACKEYPDAEVRASR